MRSSCASASVLAFALAAALSCAPKEPPAPSPEPLVSLEGNVVLAGDDPVERDVVLSDEGGTIAALRSDTLELELRNLAGHGVRVTGRLARRPGREPEFLVERYEMLPVDGAAPLVGVLEDRDGAPYLVSERGGVCRLEGPLASVLLSFAGYKVWIAGKAPAGGGGEGASGGEAGGGSSDGGAATGARLSVESYGVLLPPRATGRAR